MTSLRLFWLVGFSEILIFICFSYLMRVHALSLFRYDYGFLGFVKFYMLFSVFLVLPFVTSVIYFLTSLNSTPEYLIPFMVGVVLSFLLAEAINSGSLDMRLVSAWASFSYIVSNLITILFNPSLLDSVRYSGFANNPNQLIFYASSIALLSVIYNRNISVFLIPVIFAITLISGSDAYYLMLAVLVFSYISYRLVFSTAFDFIHKIIFYISLIIVSLFLCLSFFLEEIILLWRGADEGGERIDLYYHAAEVIFSSPLFGYGVGSFSGVDSAFLNLEAHNTFLDLSMQFGLIFPGLIYIVYLCFVLNRLRAGMYLQAAFVTSFIFSGLFHFNARHFIFWIEFGIFYHYIFYYRPSLSGKVAQ